MTTSVTELQEMLQEAHRTSGPAHYAALDTVFRHADAAGQTEFAYRARMDAISDFHHNGEYARAFLAFSSCLSIFDKHPELAASWDEQTLLWRYKWIIWELAQFAAVPLDRVLALLDDMERRYRAGNHSLHAVYQHRGIIATHLGDLDAAGHWFGEMVTARRDSLSDCQACVPTAQVEYLVARGDHEKAVRVGTPFTRGGCSEQPQQMLSQLMLPYLHTGEAGKAVDAHKKAYALIRDNRHYLELVGLHVQFCALTGNEQYGLPIVERHLPWLERPASPLAAMEFASAAVLLLRRLPTGTVIRRRTDDGSRRWIPTAAETATELETLARSLAAEFDARNGNTRQSDRVAQRLTATPILTDLPLTVLAGKPIAAHSAHTETAANIGRIAELTAAGDTAGAARVRLQVAYALRNAGQWNDAVEVAEEAQRSLDVAGLADQAIEARHLLVELYGRDWRQRRTALSLLEEILAAPSLPGTVPPRAELLEQAATLTYGPKAASHLRAAADLHRAAGDGAREADALIKAMTRTGQPPADWAELVARVDERIAAGDVPPDRILDAQARLCTAEAAAGRFEDALRRAQRHAGDHPVLRQREAALLLQLGRAAEAEERARPLVNDAQVSWQARQTMAKSLLAQGRKEDADAFLADNGMDQDDLDDEDDDEDYDDED
jgi:hypothetical protein